MSDEAQQKATTTDALEGTLESMISNSFSEALAAQTGASAQNIAAQIQQSTPFKELMEQIANEIKEQGTDIQDEAIQQALAQQAISNFGTSASQDTLRRNTTERRDIPNETDVETTIEQEQEVGTDSPTPEASTTDESTESTAEKEGQKTPDSETNPNQVEKPITDEPSRPSVDEEADSTGQNSDDTQTDTSTPNRQEGVFSPQNNPTAGDQQGQTRNQYAQGMLSDERKMAIANKADELGQRTGAHIYQDMKECRFKGFIFAVIIAIFIDALDLILQVITVGTIGTLIMDFIIKPFAGGALWFILLQQGNFVTRLLREQVAKRLIAPIVVELLPFLSILPVFTILVFWLQYTLYQERKKLAHELSLWERYGKTTKQAKKTLDKRSNARWDNIRQALGNTEQNTV